MKKNNISVIIRVKNEERYIGFCIQSVLDFFDDAEIIIINNNSTDNSLNIINHFKKDISLKSFDKRYANIKIFEISQYTPGKALNLGLSKAKNKYILILSAHCKITSFNKIDTFDYLNKDYAVFGNQIPVWNGKRIKKRYIWSNFGNKETFNIYSDQENRYFFHNAFSFFNRKILTKYPFNENLVSKEDRYWANYLIKLKHKIVYMPSNCIEHYYTDEGATWKSF